ncbi:hypothetical protein JCM6882_008575 [Rhodosporidiobolus microsporus]
MTQDHTFAAPADDLVEGGYAVFNGEPCVVTRISEDGQNLTFDAVDLFDPHHTFSASRSSYEEVCVPVVEQTTLRAGFDDSSLRSPSAPLHLTFRAVLPASSSAKGRGAGEAEEVPLTEPLDAGLKREMVDAVGVGKEVLAFGVEAMGRRGVVGWREKRE